MIILNKKDENNKVNEDVSVNYIFEINTNGNVRFVTLTDYTASNTSSYAEYYTDFNEWDGDKKDINNILSVLMSQKLTMDKLGDGFTEVYSNGKTKEFK